MQKEQNRDYHLWKSFKEGDVDAFYRLYDENVEALYSFGICFSKDSDFVKDCIHDLFLDLYKYRSTLSETDSVQFYMLRSLRRKIQKKQMEQSSLVYDEAISTVENEQEMAFEDFLIAGEIETETNRKIAEAMKTLSSKQREGLFLKFDRNLSYPEIADLLNISVESARTSIYRALKELRKYLLKEDIFISLLFLYYSRLRFSE